MNLMAMDLAEICKNFGAAEAAEIPANQIIPDTGLRAMCELGTCGRYGRNYTCPPAIGAAEALAEVIRSAKRAVVFRNTYPIEDGFDFEGMMSAQSKHNALALAVNRFLRGACHTTDKPERGGVQRGEDGECHGRFLVLTAGGCMLCGECGLAAGTPCPNPEDALSSLEAYGINVTQLCEASGLSYRNGENTVTYFAGIFVLP